MADIASKVKSIIVDKLAVDEGEDRTFMPAAYQSIPAGQ